jgi:signal transduction histidine kinase/ActR/RegA family two-component response regulator
MLQEHDDLNIKDLITPIHGLYPGKAKVSSILTSPLIQTEGLIFVVDDHGKLIGAIQQKQIVASLLNKLEDSALQDVMITLQDTLTKDSTYQQVRDIFVKTKLRFAPVTENNKPIGVVWTDSSISALYNAYRDKFEQWKHGQQKIQYRDEFLSILMHDLRSPLSSISACCDLMKMGGDAVPRSFVDLIETIKKNAFRCIFLAQDLLEFGKLNDGMNVDLQDYEIHSALDDVIKNLRIIGKQQYGVEIKTQWCGDVHVKIDPARFAQIIDNLIINALKFTPRGKCVTLKTDLIEDAKRRNYSLRIQIIDEGPGIPREKIAAVFDKYSQLDTQQDNGQNKASGVGLGLSIVSQFVRLHNGHIFVEGGGTSTGHGAIFSIILPHAIAQRASRDLLKPKNKFKVLVVDDDEDIRQTILEMLEDLPYEIRTASDGQEGYAMFLTWNPDLILSDIRMPEKTGIELLNNVKDENPNVPVVLLSGALDEFTSNDVQSALKPDAFLPKPFRSADLVSICTSILKHEPHH